MSMAWDLLSRFAMKKIMYIREDPASRLPEVIEWARRFDLGGRYSKAFDTLDPFVKDEKNNWNRMARSFIRELDPICLNKLVSNLAVNSFLASAPKRERLTKRESCNIPWAILMDPTASCNLRCLGCWAAEYRKTDGMAEVLLDRIIREGKELGIYMYIYSGGEPLVRKDDLLRLAERHQDCYFLAFSNGTLVDERFAETSRRLGNFALALSVEGFEEETDLRRGKGTYRKVIHAMDMLKSHGVPFGFSTCYHRYNTEAVGSSDYVDFMVEKGCRFGWYFTYMPLGHDADLKFLATSDQREYMYRKVREYRNSKPIFLLDFWNDGEYVNGCIAGGRNYLHINAAGDVEPCAFIHYSTANIKEMSLLDTLKQPLFREYAANQPFNENHLRPCPLLDNPEKLREMVLRSNAKSTQFLDEEDVVSLTAKCQDASMAWAARADELWNEKRHG